MRTSPSDQADKIVKLLITLIAEPKITAEQLAKSLDRTESWVNKMTMAFRDAGLDIVYDRLERRYSVGLSEAYAKSLLGTYAKKVARVLNKSSLYKGTTTFVSSLHRYDIKQFAEFTGSSASNVHNMVTGYAGAKLPSGWCAYQLTENGKWWIQKMNTDRSGKHFKVPENVQDTAYAITIGDGKPVAAGRTAALHRKQCLVPGCKKPVLARGFCSEHYYQQRQHPERFPKLLPHSKNPKKK